MHAVLHIVIEWRVDTLVTLQEYVVLRPVVVCGMYGSDTDRVVFAMSIKLDKPPFLLNIG